MHATQSTDLPSRASQAILPYLVDSGDVECTPTSSKTVSGRVAQQRLPLPRYPAVRAQVRAQTAECYESCCRE